MTAHEARTFRKFCVSDSRSDMRTVIALNLAVITEEMAHEINNFWGASEDRLRDAHGDIFRCVAMLAGQAAMRTAMQEDTEHSKFIEDAINSSEGWPRDGIRVLSVDDVPKVEFYDLDCVEQPA